ncbi:MAG: helix-turn-helix transcriptional regulator [Haloarculaceae archaeon]
MPDPLDEIVFLARSANRIEVLRTLTEGAYTRRELGAAVEASQPTVGRVLNDLAERKWVAYDGERYRATATGELVEAGITDLRARLAAEIGLRDVVDWLPTDAIDVDLRAFRDATITTPTGTRPNAPIERMLDLLERADHARLLSHTFNRQKLDCIHARTVDGTLVTEGVFAADAIDAIRTDPALRTRLRDVVAADAADISVTTADVPVALEITDDRTRLLLRDGDGIVRASIDTDAGAVRSWAVDLYETYADGATPLTPADLD